MRLDDLNALPEERAVADLLRCCGSTQWARLMSAARPFASLDAARERADAIWRSLGPDDWLEAFAAHPRIGEGAGAGGERPASREESRAAAASWSEQEQAGVRSADAAARDPLAEANRQYEAHFGYIFIVCATGRSAGAMLAMLERRLTNEPDIELRTAAEEQRMIMQLRIAKLITP